MRHLYERGHRFPYKPSAQLKASLNDPAIFNKFVWETDVDWGSYEGTEISLDRVLQMVIEELQQCKSDVPFDPLYPDIRGIVAKTSGLVDVLKDSLDHPEIDIAFVFDSVAGDRAHPGSDVDLMVIGSITLHQLVKLLSKARATTGREINPHVFSAEEVLRRKSARDHFLIAVLSGPKLFLVGSEDELKVLDQ